GGVGVDRVIEAVGVDAVRPHEGPAAKAVKDEADRFKQEVREVAPVTRPKGDNWRPGDAPSLALTWAVESLAKAGTLAIIGVYPETARTFPVGNAVDMNLTVKMGNCPHRRYIPMLLKLVRSHAVRPSAILSQREPLTAVLEAYEAFDRREAGWMKVKLEPALAGTSA
ncbi:MAG TPA: hypothetical protein VFA38_01000, partial [Nitrospirales bacterium]|nr:hypothetical protein [Nitrospirales bacterium]